ncbi:MAG: hypothetical protein OXC38_01230 [Gammaproteobacteria bacterium]|nr:hypothetical protein [Gammaproteobacteria bacterium]
MKKFCVLMVQKAPTGKSQYSFHFGNSENDAIQEAISHYEKFLRGWVFNEVHLAKAGGAPLPEITLGKLFNDPNGRRIETYIPIESTIVDMFFDLISPDENEDEDWADD